MAGVIPLALWLCSYTHQVAAGENPDYELPELVVTASRIPSTYNELTRAVRIIDRAYIESSPAHNVQDLLLHAAGVDLRQRGPLGVQADVSMRGGTFEQTLFLIDGIKVNDPQTGHHNLNLPLTLNDIDRIEIVEGHGSRLYGPNAFGGVINVITRKDRGESLSLGAFGGAFGLIGGDLSLSQSGRALSHRLSLSGTRSSGHREHTDSRIVTGFWKVGLKGTVGEGTLAVGHTSKVFGANGYYSDRFLNEWEHTSATLLTAQARFDLGGLELSPRAYWRRHGDDFILDRERPDWFRNKHTTNTRGIDFDVLYASGWGTTSLGAEAASDGIESPSLGDHSQFRGGMFFEHRVTGARGAALALGASAYRHPGWGWTVQPGVDFGYNVGRRVRVYGSLGNSYRTPTYTEFHYDSPANKGNENLGPEKAWTYEAGLRYGGPELRADVVAFRRNGRNLIDWVRAKDTDPWQVQNTARSGVNGIDLSLEYRPHGGDSPRRHPGLRVGYSYLDGSRSFDSFESKYLEEHLRHRLTAAVTGRLGSRFRHTWMYSYRVRSGQSGHQLLDLRLSLNQGRSELYAEATNLLNTQYSDIGSVRMPGRWLLVGVRYAVNSGD